MGFNHFKSCSHNYTLAKILKLASVPVQCQHPITIWVFKPLCSCIPAASKNFILFSEDITIKFSWFSETWQFVQENQWFAINLLGFNPFKFSIIIQWNITHYPIVWGTGCGRISSGSDRVNPFPPTLWMQPYSVACHRVHFLSKNRWKQ